MGMMWDEANGIGYFPVDQENAPYDEAYFAKYQGYADSELGRSINRYRLNLVSGIAGELPVLDVGIGCGQFIESRGGETYGVDINPAGVRWLNERGLYRPWDRPIECMTFWDSFEHFPEPTSVVANATRFVFVSIPIFNDHDHAARSKHFRPDEHYWYFTEGGMVSLMARMGFNCLYIGDTETTLGREDISTFVFSRR